MKSVFEASTGLDAHMILNLLQQEGIDGRVEGEYLQGGIGELSAINVVRVVVDETDYEKARSIISDWESIQPDQKHLEKPLRKSSRAGLGFLLGLLLGIGSMYWAYNSPVTEEGVDHNRDGKLDEVWIYKDDRISLAEIDRNKDGKIDLIQKFDRKGIAYRAESDDNFDGFYETIYSYQNGNTSLQEADLNQDGVVDYRAFYKNGLLDVVEIFDPVTNVLRKKQKFVMNKLSSAEYDFNEDGTFDVTYEYDHLEEVKSKSNNRLKGDTQTQRP
jgi:antitoxin component YwqK of YwqJK toxin-antitoxin module